MELLQTIRKAFAYMSGSGVEPITLKEVEPCWIVKIDGKHGVAIEIPRGIIVNEQFSNAYFYTKEYIIDGQEVNLLVLISDDNELRNEFANICVMFLEKGPDGEERNKILDNPMSWWQSLKSLIGNTQTEKSAYSLLGEMLSYLYLIRQGEKVNWGGPFSSSIDIEGMGTDYEIKSTVKRYKSEVTINSQYQLTTERPKKLIFCRFEQSENGICINQVVDLLVLQGVSKEKIEKSLKYLRFLPGSEIRSKSYKLLEATMYEIDERFPSITPDSFKDDKLPEHIIGLTYMIDLHGLPGKALKMTTLNYIAN
ncbi:PD-(D/E)XK motif protein [Peribacillus butanolivorans]|uniref:PD-(D/E)XK motif protein n=1 Tax=Peribacillus butanolivorans TaxID=421767 RepID=UPI0037CB1BEE